MAQQGGGRGLYPSRTETLCDFCREWHLPIAVTLIATHFPGRTQVYALLAPFGVREWRSILIGDGDAFHDGAGVWPSKVSSATTLLLVPAKRVFAFGFQYGGGAGLGNIGVSVMQRQWPTCCRTMNPRTVTVCLNDLPVVDKFEDAVLRLDKQPVVSIVSVESSPRVRRSSAVGSRDKGRQRSGCRMD